MRALTGLLAGMTVLSLSVGSLTGSAADEPVRLIEEQQQQLPADVIYNIQIDGTISTPSETGPQRFPLKSTGAFRFRNYPKMPADGDIGPLALKAVRRFESAATTTVVNSDHTTDVQLQSPYRTLFVAGSNQGLVQWSPRYALPRRQLDLVQMPFDVLAVTRLLPASAVKVGEKWNTDPWLVPMLTGVEAVVEQSATCELLDLNSEHASIEVQGMINGAVHGSAVNATFSAKLTFDRKAGMITSFSATQKEKRSAGPVSPGLDVVATLSWKQTPVTEADDPPLEIPATFPADSQLQLALQTPLKLQLRHSREWHLFHETSAVMMIRQLRNGTLISQCNISTAITVPPKQHTPDREFLADVTESVRERKGRILKEETVRDDDRWRIRHVRAVGNADGKQIIWDYYLCSAATGEQFSLVFSHAEADDALFGEEASELLKTLQIIKPRPALPFR